MTNLIMRISMQIAKSQFFLSCFFCNTTTKEEEEIYVEPEGLHTCPKEEYEQYKKLINNKQIMVFVKLFEEIFPKLYPVHYRHKVVISEGVDLVVDYCKIESVYCLSHKVLISEMVYFDKLDSIYGLNHFFLNSFFQIYLKDLMTYFKDPHITLFARNPRFSWCDFSPDFLEEMKNLYTKINFFIGEEEGKQVIFEISKDKTSVKRIENREKEQEILKTLEEKRNKLFEKILFKKDIFDLIESDSKEIQNLIGSK